MVICASAASPRGPVKRQNRSGSGVAAEAAWPGAQRAGGAGTGTGTAVGMTLTGLTKAAGLAGWARRWMR